MFAVLAAIGIDGLVRLLRPAPDDVDLVRRGRSATAGLVSTKVDDTDHQHDTGSTGPDRTKEIVDA